MTTWHDIAWRQTMGGNDSEGDCGPVSMADLGDLLLFPQVVGRTEIERLYTLASGWMAEKPGTDKGVVLDQLIQEWIDNGWPADPTWRPTAYEVFKPADIGAALRLYRALPCALALPVTEGFTDAALGLPGTLGHAVLVVEASDAGVWFVTWAEVQFVSWAWWMQFARAAYGITIDGNVIEAVVG